MSSCDPAPDAIRIALVVAVSRNGVIGVAGGLPWRLPSDLKRFKEITLGHPCIMGRKTWQTLRGPLPGRDNIVVTRSGLALPEGVHRARSLAGALALACKLAQARNVQEIMVIGGGEIYREALPGAHRVYLSRVDVEVVGDTLFPDLDLLEWRETAREPHQRGPKDSAAFTLVTLDRIRAAGATE